MPFKEDIEHIKKENPSSEAAFSWRRLKEAREPRPSQIQRKLAELERANLQKENQLKSNRFRHAGKKLKVVVSYFAESMAKARNYQLRTFLHDHWQLLIKSAAENHLRIQQAKQNPQEGESCGLTFTSYSELKRYQKKVRLFTFSASSTFASVMVAILITQIIFPGGITHGATFHFQQINWNSQTANTANHNSNQTGWGEYQSKDAGITMINGGADVQLQQVAGSNTQTSDTDFNIGTLTNTSVSGTGAPASVGLTKLETANAWTTLTNTNYNASYGAGITYDDNGNMYAIFGNYSSGFSKYNIATNAWTNPVSLPYPAAPGAAITYDGNGNIFISGTNTLSGDLKGFYQYNINSGTMTAKAAFPGSGGSYGGAIISDRNGHLFALYGSGSAGFYKYDIATDTWSTMASVTASPHEGAALTYDNNGNIYYLRGASTNGFYKYNIGTNAWSTLTVIPGLVSGGGALTYDNNGSIYATQGNGTTNFWKYNIASNTWSSVAARPSSESLGGGLAYANGKIYSLGGSNGKLFYQYSLYDNYQSSGSFESGTIDLGVKADINALDFGATTPAGTTLKTQIATSDNPAGPWNYVDYSKKQSGIPVYYSVGQNTSDHKTGTPTVSIVSGVATFSVAQIATNMGVGDKVTYNGASVAYISGKISSTQWKVITATGGVPTDVSGQAVNTIAHAFSSLASSIAGSKDASHLNTADLVGGNYQLNIPCYYDSGADTSAVTVSGFTTSSTNFIKIYTPNNTSSEVNQSQRHQGKWNDGKYALVHTINFSNAITIQSNNVEVEGLQISLISTGQSLSAAIKNDYTGLNNNTLSSLIIRGNIGNNENWGVYSNAKITVVNSVIYGFNASIGDTAAIRFADSNATVSVISNVTIYDCRYGLRTTWLGTFLAKNVITQNCTDGFSGLMDASSDYNISNLAGDATGAHSKNSTTVSFVDAANKDFHLASGDSAARNAGVNLAADANYSFNLDADGQLRSGTWDIGADEEGASSLLGINRYVRYKIAFTGGGGGWSTLADMPANSQTGYFAYDNNGNIYGNQGYDGFYRNVFWKYNIASNTWSALANMPANSGSGALTYDQNGNIYAMQGYDGTATTNAFWKYNIASNTWSVLATLPGASKNGTLVYDNNGNLFASQGNDGTSNTAAFWKYNITTNTWSAMAAMPNVGSGGDAVFSGGYIYLTQGNFGTGFWRYNIVANTWSTMTAAPATVSSGALTYDQNGNIYASRGSNTDTFWKYNIASNTWSTLNNMPAISSGGSFAYGGSGVLYANRGYDGSSATTKTFWKYNTRTSVTPNLNDLTLSYTSYPASASLISSPYNSTDTANILAKLQWTETNPAGTDTTFQVRTSPDNNTWTSWVGPDGTSGTEFTDPAGGEVMPNVVHDGAGDQYIQYKAILHSDGTATPTLSDIDATYVVNAPPQVQNVIATQNADGTVSVSYDIKDSDTLTGNLNGFVNTSLQYCSANCAVPGGETWTSAVTTGGDLGSVAVEENNFTTHVATWTPKTDYANQYNAVLKMRIVANDNEAANNLAYGTSNAFALDTKNPTNVALTINGQTKQLTLATPNDDSSYQMELSNFADFHDATPEAFTTSKNWPTLTADPATVYLRITDAKGNRTAAQAVTPQKPKNIVYFDVSNAQSGDYREFIAWSVVNPTEVGAGFGSYEVERKENNGAFSSLASQIDREANFWMDNAVNSSTAYTYRAYTQDINGNKSAYSDVVSDIPNGQGGTDTTAPTINNVTIENTTPTTATITWTTDEMADSSIGYSLNTDYDQEYGTGSMSIAHSITLTNLVPETTYHIKVKSRDPIGNLGEADASNPGANQIGNFTFATLAGPKITNVNFPVINNTDATITWITDINADSKVNYATALSNGSLVNPQSVSDNTQIKNHSISLTNLIENTKYYVEVVSRDAGNNTTTDKNGGNFFELVTTQDTTAPEIQNLNANYVYANSAIISFTTDEPSKVKINYGKTSKNLSQTITTYDRSHAIFLGELSSETDYIYEVEVVDIKGNSQTSSQQSFKTTKNTEFVHDPLSAIENIETPVITDTEAIVKFGTDQPANCLLEYGTKADTYDGVPQKEAEGKFGTSHSFHLAGLIFQTPYFYKLTCEDNLENSVVSAEQTFTTKEKQLSGSEWGASGGAKDSVPPSITNVKVENVTGESATISWETDEQGSSSVRYGLDNNYGSTAGNDTVNDDTAHYVTSHSVTVNGLVPGTKYVYRALSTDVAGNIAQSSEATFTTTSIASLSSIEVISKNLGEAVISWTSSVETSSIVEYGLTTGYGEKKENNSLTKEHSVTLSNLNQGVKYHFMVKGRDQNGKYFASSDQTFEPKSPAKITNISVNDVTEHSATVSFVTDVPTDANVTYTDVANPKVTGSQGSRNLVTDHVITLDNLTQGTTFSLLIEAKDEQGTDSSEPGPDFTTGKDENPPKIDQVRTDSALTQSDKVQTIINWKTDEQATTALVYKESRSGEEKEVKITDNLTTGHVAVITTFKAGAVYYFKVKSIDASGNTALSNEFALLTPKRKENIIQVIINNFQDIFGWARR